MRLLNLTVAQQDLLDQILWLDNHFKTNHDQQCFSQSVGQFVKFFADKQGYVRSTMQVALRKLEELGLVTIAYNAGFKGANLFFVHVDKYQELLNAALEGSVKTSEAVLNVFKDYIKAAVKLGREAVKCVSGDVKPAPVKPTTFEDAMSELEVVPSDDLQAYLGGASC